ncbi:MAG: type II toxin-antitoxin system HicB family antitoxin [Pigmentiphaga sp.]|nr:type II toxin-antitoxin system HicB family antitoxin [Pigmentiphaga sp.]
MESAKEANNLHLQGLIEDGGEVPVPRAIARRLVLTDKGRDLLASAVPIWTETHRAVESTLGTSDPDRLRAGLNAFL